jgi:formate-dependent nitrite reductase membrane component NrfD
MSQLDSRMVGNSFRLGYRFQRYWDTSMANAFFAAEAGTGLFIVAMYFDFLLGMVVGLAIAGTIKPYFHLSHMGVPAKAWRAILRPDRSWISRGALSIGVLVGAGSLYIIDQYFALFITLGLPVWLGVLVKYAAIAGGLTVMCYQGMAMSHSSAIGLWASPLLPISSFLYAVTCGVMLTAVLGWNSLQPESLLMLLNIATGLFIFLVVIVLSLLSVAKNRSRGGAYSVELLTKSIYANWFIRLVLVIGLIVPALLLAFVAHYYLAVIVASAALLAGFYCFRVLLFKAGVYEPLSNDLVNSLGL